MNQHRIPYVIVVALVLVVFAAFLALLFSRILDLDTPGLGDAEATQSGVQASPSALSVGLPLYSPPRPEEAPDDIREDVMLGYHVMNETGKYAKEYVGNDLACSNCHFEGGITAGGKGGGLSLVGVAAKYPKYRKRQKGSADLVQRTEGCFERSQNGTAPPPDSDIMVGLMTYYHWISKDIPIYQDVPWLGLMSLTSNHEADLRAGEKVYERDCSACHGGDGAGTAIAPPLWGPGSYNDGAGMSDVPKLAPFAYLNMPKGNPILSVEQAMDVALYVNTQPRPHFTSKGGGGGGGASGGDGGDKW